MLKFLGVLALMAGTFSVGYFMGQRPLGSLQQSVRELSRSVMDTTLGIERDFRRRKGLVDAKARVVQAKAELFDKNFGDAAKELAEAVDALETTTLNPRQQDPAAQIKDLSGKIRELRLELSLGKKVTQGQLTDVQKELDALLNK